MAAIEELWEATHLPATLLNFQDQEDAQYSPDGPDNGSSLSEEDYVEMFTEFPTSEDFIDIAMLAEETEENEQQEGVDITYVYEQDMVNALDSALNSALANFNFLHSSNEDEETYIFDNSDVEDFATTTSTNATTKYTSTISTLDITNTWDSWVEEANAEEEISQLESEILYLEEELVKAKRQRFLLLESSNSIQNFHSCLYSSFELPSSLSRKRKLRLEELKRKEEEEEEADEDEPFSTLSEEEVSGYFADEEEVDIDDSESDSDSSSDEESDSDSDSSSSDTDDSDSDSSSDSDSDNNSESSDESEESEEESKTIYIPFKKRKVPISIFRQNRVKLIKSEEQDCEEDVDILN